MFVRLAEQGPRKGKIHRGDGPGQGVFPTNTPILDDQFLWEWEAVHSLERLSDE
jgi:hypothetical protein